MKLRGALLLTAATMAFLVPGGCARTPEHEARRALAQLEDLMHDGCGGTAEYDETDPERPLIGLDLGTTEILDAGFRHVGKIPTIRTLKLATLFRFTDNGLAYLTGLSALETLDVRGTVVTDAGLRHLSGLVRLKQLDLGDNLRITDAGLKHLHNLNELRTLGVVNTAVTEGGIAELKLVLPNVKIEH